MATQTSSQDLNNLTINRVTSPEAFEQMISAGVISANEFYLVEGEDETVDWSKITNKPRTFPPPTAANDTLGGIKTNYPASDKSYAIKVDNNGNAYVNVPWTDDNTTYTFANGTNGFTVTPSGGTAQTVTVTPSIANNITGSGTSGYLTKFNGTNTITNGPQITSGGTGFLKQDGTWATPTDTNKYHKTGSWSGLTYTATAVNSADELKFTLPTATSSAKGVVQIGDGITINNGTISVTAANLGLSNALHFIGITTTALEDGDTTATLAGSGLSKTTGFVAGDVVIDSASSYEYVWTGSAWERLGPDGSYKILQTAISDNTGTADGTNKSTSFIYSFSQNANGELSVKTRELDTSGTWSGKLSKTFKVKLNNTQYTYDGSASVDLSTIYAPTEAGTSGYVLTSSGSGVAPSWTAQTALTSVFQTLSSSTNTLTVKIGGTQKTANLVNSVSNAWTGGTSAGPTLTTTVNGVAGNAAVIPSAGAGTSGIVTTGAQQFDGNKTFKGNILPQATNTYSLGTSGYRWSNLYVGTVNTDAIKFTDASTEANRLVWTNDTKTLQANNHYADATHVAINTETAQNENFYVNGSSQFNLGNTDTADLKQFLINGNNRQLSMGAAEIQAYSSNLPSQLYLNFIGDNTSNPPGNVSIGNEYGGSLGLYNTTLTSGTGISLSSGPENGIPKTGIAYASISTYGFYGGVDGNQNAATYLTVSTINHDGANIGQNTNAHSGWIFKNVNKTANTHLTEGNIASVGVNGYFYGKGFAVYNAAGDVRYGYMYLNSEGVEDQTETNGVTTGDIRLVLGNNKSVTAEALSDKIDNARGTIYLYGTEDSFTRIRHGEWYGSNLVVPINNIVSGKWTANTAADEARRIDVRSGAGVIYAQSDATTAGNKGIYLTSADGTNSYGITFNQSNQVHQIANFNTNIVFTDNGNGYGVTRPGVNSSWNNSQARALLRISSINGGLAALWSLKSTNGYWIGSHYDDGATTNPSYQNHYLIGFLHDNNVPGVTGALNRYTFSAELIPPSITPSNATDRNAFVTVDYNGTTAAKGTATKPVYIDSNSVVQEATYELKATVNNGTQNQLAYYSTNTVISSTPHITRGDYSLKITGDASNASQYQVTNGTHTISLHQAAGGNRGIYQNSSSEWLLYWPNADTTAYINQNGGNVQIGKSGNTSSNLILYGTLYLRRSAASTTATSPGRISWYGAYGGTNNYVWYDYVSDATNGMCPTGGKPSTPENVTSWAKRSLISGTENYGWVWESAANAAAGSTTTQPTAIFSISSYDGRALLNTSCATNNYAGPSLKIISSTAIGSGQYSHMIQCMASGLNAGGGALISIGKSVDAYNAGSLIFNYVENQSSANYLSLGFVNHQHLFKFYGAGKMQIPYGASGYSNADSVYSLRLGADTESHLDLGYNGMQSQKASNEGVNILYLNYAGGNVIAGSNNAGGSLGVRNISSTSGAGISLYGNGPAVGDLPTYGEALAGTATFGTHDGATASWATYFTTAASGTGRGWVFKAYDSANKTSGNVASIRAADGLLFNCGVSLRHPNIPGQWCGDFYINTVGTATTEGKVYLRVGNNVAAGTAGNEKGQLVLYGSGVNYTAITTNATANTAVTFPATVSGQVPLVVLPVRTTFTEGGTWTLANFNIRSQATPATTDYYLPMMNQNGATYLSDVLRTSVRIYNGTTEGYAGLLLGNNIPTGTAGAAHGYMYIFTTGTTAIGISGQQGALDGTNTVDYLQINNNLKATKVWGSVYNDYAEFRKTETVVEPGRCVKEIGDDSLEITVKRLERGCEIVSDTYGFAIGATESAKTPIASSGRVLAYPYEPREEFASHIGWPVCSGPNGTVSIMTEEEEEKYPSRIIGTISAVPDYEEWGEDNIKVNGRVWIRIR